MRKISFTLFMAIALTLSAQYSFGAPTADLTTEELRHILDQTPENERYEFLRKNIELGYRINELHQEWPNNEEADLAVRIFNYAIRNQQPQSNKKTSDNFGSYKDQICLPPPVGCFDPDDPSIHPE